MMKPDKNNRHTVDDGVELLQNDHAIHRPPYGRYKNDLGIIPLLLRRGEDGRSDGEDLVAIVPKRDQEFIHKHAVQVISFIYYSIIPNNNNNNIDQRQSVTDTRWRRFSKRRRPLARC